MNIDGSRRGVEFDVSGYPSGLYFVVSYSDTEKSQRGILFKINLQAEGGSLNICSTSCNQLQTINFPAIIVCQIIWFAKKIFIPIV